ncbi:MAG: PqqD family peptide modification chaperone [Pyrinomonadaceae bacterium]
MNTVKPVARTSSIIVQEQNDECLLFDLVTNKAYCLNPTATYVWSLCNGKNSISDIRILVEKKFKANVTNEYIDLSIDLLSEQQLLENANEIRKDVATVNRRELLRKVGFGAAIALPLVTSIFAPTAASAQSGGSGICDLNGAPCSPVGSPCYIPDTCDLGSGTCSTTPTRPCTSDADCTDVGNCM